MFIKKDVYNAHYIVPRKLPARPSKGPRENLVTNLKISILGTRGIPARYGGFETCVEEIAVRLVRRRHEVTVYCRTENPSARHREYKGVELIDVPAFSRRFIAAPFNSFTTTVLGSLSDADILHYFGCGNALFSLLGRLVNKSTVLTVDGLEWNRQGYSWFARAYLRSFAELAMVFPSRTIADSESSQRWYQSRTGVAPEYIPYGTELSRGIDVDVLKKYGLEEDRYVLFAGRLVYEKGVHTLVEAFKSVKTDLKLVVVGEAPESEDYIAGLKKSADGRTMFLGYLYGDDFETVRNAALLYVHPSLLDGTSISLLGAMGAGRAIISSDIRENQDVAGDSAIYFRRGESADLSQKLQDILKDPDRIEKLGKASLERASRLYDWDTVTNEYERIYRELLARHSQRAGRERTP